MNKSVVFLEKWPDNIGYMHKKLYDMNLKVARLLHDKSVDYYMAFPEIHETHQDSYLKVVELPVFDESRHRKVDLEYLRRIYRFVRQHNVKVVVVYDLPLFWGFTPFFKLLGAKVFYYNAYGFREEDAVTPFKFYIKACIHALGIFSFDGYIAINDYFIRRYHDLHAVKSDKVELIYNAVDEKKYSKSAENAGLINDDKIIILSVAQMRSEKRIDYLVDIAAEVLKVRDNVRFIHVGDGGCMQDVAGKVKALQIEENFKLVGGMSDVRPYLNAASVFVHTAAREGLCNAVSEAMCYELPVVAINIDGMDAQVIDKETGYLCEFGDKPAFVNSLLALIDDADLRRKLGKAGRKRAEEVFSTGKEAQAFTDYLCRFI